MIRKKYLGNQKGFTLIELLIVVGIIALLVSILMPALRAAKERSKRLLCSSQLHQLGVVFSQYAQDFDDYFPIFHYNKGCMLMSIVADDTLTWLGDGFGSEMFAQLAPGHYGLPHKVFYCPGMQPNKYHGYMADDWWWYRFDETTGNRTYELQNDQKADGTPNLGCKTGGVNDNVWWGYAYYVQRRENCGTGTYHPFGPTTGGTAWVLNAGRDYLAPQRTSGRTAPFNPIVTDTVHLWRQNTAAYGTGFQTQYASIVNCPGVGGDIKALTGLVGREKVKQLDSRSTHVSNTGLITQTNSLYADGRVVENPGETVVPYYAGGIFVAW